MAATLEKLIVVCAACGAANRVPAERLGEAPKCGKCSRLLLDGQPIVLDAGNFDSFVGRNDLPVLVDFWADWCGPCHAMAPAFQRAAEQMKTQARFAKVDTERSQALAARYNIRSIPTLVLIRKGQEIGRISGARDAGAISTWVTQQLRR